MTDVCHRHRLRGLALFGSGLCRDCSDRSEVDVLIDPDPDHPHQLSEIISMQDELEAMIGRKVDIVDKHLLKKYIREDILRRRRVLYVSWGPG